MGKNIRKYNEKRVDFTRLKNETFTDITLVFSKNCNFIKCAALKRSQTTKQITMKTKLTLMICVAVVAVVLASCGAGRTASCDAYGSVQQTENSDLAAK
jgi:hypothetical protein